MEVVEYTVKRIVLTPEEKAVKKAWGSKWNIIKKYHDKYGFFYVIIGEWSGYTSSQRKVVHFDICDYGFGKKYEDSNGFIGTIKYSDNTTLQVRSQLISLRQIMYAKITPRISYTDLIKKLVDSGENTYTV